MTKRSDETGKNRSPREHQRLGRALKGGGCFRKECVPGNYTGGCEEGKQDSASSSSIKKKPS